MANFADSSETAATDDISAPAADLRVPTHTYRCYKCPLAISGLKSLNYPQGVAFLVGPHYLGFSMNPYFHRCQRRLKVWKVSSAARTNLATSCCFPWYGTAFTSQLISPASGGIAVVTRILAVLDTQGAESVALKVGLLDSYEQVLLIHGNLDASECGHDFCVSTRALRRGSNRDALI